MRKKRTANYNTFQLYFQGKMKSEEEEPIEKLELVKETGENMMG